jgi:hypothetical protein
MNRKLFTILGLALFLFCAAAVQAKPREKGKAMPFKLPAGAKATVDTVFFDNFETDTMGWDTMDMATQKPYWNINTYSPVGAYSGHHWWCGTDEFNGIWPVSPGYGNGWVQLLYSPAFDLTSIAADSVQLKFYHYYSIEPPTAPADDWDCVNLWGSTDGGSNWFVMYPDTFRSEGGGAAKYNLKKSYAWTYTGMVPDTFPVPGWGGTNGGWRYVVFDLSPYKGQNLSLRFAAVSDPLESDENSTAGYHGAWYMDNISVDTVYNTGERGPLFFDDCETGNLGWTAGSKPPQIHWHKSSLRSTSPVTAWYCGDEATQQYSWGYSDAIVSPLIDLTPVQNTQPCYVDFKVFSALPDDGTDANTFFDSYSVDISSDSGKSWAGVTPYIYIDNTAAWVDQSVIGVLDISNYIGKIVQIRIGMNSDGDLNVGEGLYVDDFIVTGKTREPLPAPGTICLVDNDGNATDLSENSWTKYMEASLANLGYKYSVVTIGSNKVMTPGYLEQYPLVIWNLGANYDYRTGPGYRALTAIDQANIMSYLNNGGRLWMAGQYFFFANGTQLDTTVHPNLWSDYLHLLPENGWAAVRCDTVTGVTGDPIGGGLADSLLYQRLCGGGTPWTDPDKSYSLYPDTANYAVEGSFLSNDGSWNGIRYQDPGAGYRFVYTSFPFEAVSLPAKRDTLMARVISWLGPLSPEYSPPAVPTGLVLSQNYDTVKCVWRANAEPDIWGYNVYRSTQSGIPAWSRLGTALHPDTTFADTTAEAGLTYNYALTALDTCVYPANESLKSLWSRITVTAWKLGLEGQPVSVIPARFSLEQNQPNPFRGNTEIKFALPRPGRVELSVYNVAGQKVAAPASGDYPAGYHSIRWNGKDGQGRALSNGVYFYRLEALGQGGPGSLTQTKRLIIVK